MKRMIRRLVVLTVVAGFVVSSPSQALNIVNSLATTGVQFIAEVQSNGSDSVQASTQSALDSGVVITLHDKGQPVLWDTCDQVDVIVNPGMVTGARTDVVNALAEISAISGVKFRVVGSTTENPRRDWYQSSVNPAVLIGFTDSSDLFVNASALGATVANPQLGHLVTGSVAIRANWYQKASAGQRKMLLLHELGHLIGLGHSENSDELMSAFVGRGTDATFTTAEIKFFAANQACRN